MAATAVRWRSSPLYYAIQRRLSNITTNNNNTPTLLLRLRHQTITQSLAALSTSSSATVCRTKADWNAKDDNDDLSSSFVDDGQNLDQNQTEVEKNAPPPPPPPPPATATTVVVRPRASNAHHFHRIKLTPANQQQQQQQQQQQHVSNNGTGTRAPPQHVVAPVPPRATCAAQRSFVRIKPVTMSVLPKTKETTVVVKDDDDDDDDDSILKASSSLLRQKQQQQHYKAQEQQQQQRVNNAQPEQQEQEQPQQYRRHGKSNKHNNNANANSSSSSPTVPFPTSCWVQVDGISPLSSLDAILASVQTALQQQQQQQANGGGILDYLDSGDAATIPSSNVNDFPWVVERARVILSPFARPTGWFLKFRNRSIVHALLTHAHDHPIQSGWKIVKIKECKDKEKDGDSDKEEEESIVVSDATLRIENCSHDTTTYDLVNMFSRFDLAVRLSSSFPSVHEWTGTTPEGRLAPPGTFLVHFADASWARAALREKQGMIFKGRQLRLAQYPRQI